jgi:hypothetical protein
VRHELDIRAVVAADVVQAVRELLTGGKELLKQQAIGSRRASITFAFGRIR